jgi:phage gpG-like protein
MTGAVLEIEWDDAMVRDACERLKTFGERQSDEFWDAVGHSLVSHTQMRFDTQSEPDGTPWLPSQRAKRTGGQTLYEEGFLFASQTYNILPGGGVEQGSNRVYAAAMQFGNRYKVYARSQSIYRSKEKLERAANTPFGEKVDMSLYRFVKKSKATFESHVEIPEHDVYIHARPYLGMSADNANEISALAGRHLEAALLGDRP